jgi:copper chaperone CopZ
MNKMMNLLLTVLLVVSVSKTGGADQTSADREAPSFKAGHYDSGGVLVTVIAKGLVCEFCAKSLEKVLMRQESVSGVNVDLTTKEILISLKEGYAMDDAMIEKLINDSGYNVATINRSHAGRVR